MKGCKDGEKIKRDEKNDRVMFTDLSFVGNHSNEALCLLGVRGRPSGKYLATTLLIPGF